MSDTSNSSSFAKRNSSAVTLSSVGSSFSDSFDGNGSLIPPCHDILPPSNNIIKIAVLSSWDNVMGPKALCIWKQSDREAVFNSVKSSDSQDMQPPNNSDSGSPSQNSSNGINVEGAVKYVVGHTLHGELSKQVTRSRNFRTEMFIVPHRNFLVNAIIFGVSTDDDEESVGHSFSIVCNSDSLEYFMNIQYLCDVWQQRMAAKIRVFLSMGNIQHGIDRLSSTLLNFCNMLCSLQLSGLTSRPMVSESYLSMRHALDRKLLERAIVSHLQTCGCSVVVGDDEKSVNLMINTLSQFVQNNDLATCRPVIREKPWPYYSGLFLQGLLKDQYGEADISAQDVLHSPFPVTIVDIPHCKVRQSSNFHEHTLQRHRVLRQELIALMASPDKNLQISPFSSMFQTVSDRGSLVPQLLVELSTLPPTESVLQRHIQDFYRKLEYKAISVLKYLEFLRSNSMIVNVKIVQKHLGLDELVDVHIILSVAERLRPGIYSYIITGGHGIT